MWVCGPAAADTRRWTAARRPCWPQWHVLRALRAAESVSMYLTSSQLAKVLHRSPADSRRSQCTTLQSACDTTISPPPPRSVLGAARNLSHTAPYRCKRAAVHRFEVIVAMETTMAAAHSRAQSRHKTMTAKIGHGRGSSAINLLRIGRSVHRNVLRDRFRMSRTDTGRAHAINRLVARRRQRSGGEKRSALTAAWRHAE